MKRINRIIVGLAALSFGAFAQADVINLATGLDSGGNVIGSGGQADANWTVSGANNYSGYPNAYTVFPGNADWYGGWLNNDGTSDWVAAAWDNSNNGAFTGTRSFNLTAGQLATASFADTQFSLDDQGQVLLNGHVEATLGGGNWGTMHDVTLNTGDLVAGQNMLQVQITSSDNYLEGVRFAGTLTVETVPEPASMSVLALGGLALLRKHRR